MSAADIGKFDTLRFESRGRVGWLWLANPAKANAMGFKFWSELPRMLEHIEQCGDVAVIVIAGEGRNFSAGAELELLDALVQEGRAEGCRAAAQERLRSTILRLQDGFSAIERCSLPVIAAVHGACIGAGLDLIAACDLRYASADAKFCLKEIDYAVVPDVGSLQRLRHIIGLPALSELAYTADAFDGARALQLGLVSSVYESADAMFEATGKLAARIAAKPALSLRGVKRNLLYSRDHSVQEGLEYVATWNAWALPSDDCVTAIAAQKQRMRPR